MSQKLVSIIDIGTTKITTLIALASSVDDKPQIIGVNSTPAKGVKKGLIVDIEEATNSIQESVEKAERMSGHKISELYFSIGGPHISSLNSRGVVAISNPKEEITQDDINRVIEAARAISLSSTREIIEVTPRSFTVDGQDGIKNPLGMKGVRLEVECHIITALQANLNNIYRCFSLLGIKPKGAIFSGLASAEAVLTETEKELGVVLVDIGGGKTDICLYVDNSLSYSSSIPVGARHITNDIAIGLRVSLDSAERIKIFLSQSENQRNKQLKKDQIDISSLQLPEKITEISYKNVVEEIIQARLEEMFKLIFEEIEKSGYGNQIPSGLVITGGGASTVNLTTVGKKIIGLPIRIGIPDNITGFIDEIIYPQFATAVGLILLGKKDLFLENESDKFSLILKDISLNQWLSKIINFFKIFRPQ